jgi:hypothetical protein
MSSKSFQNASKLNGIVSVLQFGAVGDGTTDDTGAVNAALAEGNAFFQNGTYNIASAPTFTGEKIFEVDASASVTGTGASGLGLTNGGLAKHQLLNLNTSGGDTAVQYVRRIANHSGGTPGWVSTAISARTDVTNAAATNFEWAVLGAIYNSANAGENVGVYGQGNKQSTGPTWGMTAEARDTSNISNPTTGLVGIEVDTFANGFDPNNSRVGIDVVIGKNNSSGTLCETAFGIRIGTVNGDITQGRVKYGVHLNAITFDCGFDTSGATQAAGGVAYRLGQGQKLSFTAFNDRYMTHNSGVLQYWAGGVTPEIEITDTHVFRTFVNVQMINLPTSASGLASGSLWRDTASGNVIKMVP